MFEDFEVIHSYTRKEAIEDGVLVDMNKYIPVNESGYKYPAACTAGVWNIIDQAVNNKKYGNDYKGIICDIFNISRIMPFKRWQTGAMFRVIITGIGNQKYHTLKLECGPDDDGKPCLTFMLPDED